MAALKNIATYLGTTAKQGIKYGASGYGLGYAATMVGGVAATIAVGGLASVAGIPLAAGFAIGGIISSVPAILGGPGTKFATAGIAAAFAAVGAVAFIFSGAGVAGLAAVSLGAGIAGVTALAGSAVGAPVGKFLGAIGLLKGMIFDAPRAVGQNKEREVEKDTAQAKQELLESQQTLQQAESTEVQVAQIRAQQRKAAGQRAPAEATAQETGEAAHDNYLYPDAANGKEEYHREKYNATAPREITSRANVDTQSTEFAGARGMGA